MDECPLRNIALGLELQVDNGAVLTLATLASCSLEVGSPWEKVCLGGTCRVGPWGWSICL